MSKLAKRLSQTELMIQEKKKMIRDNLPHLYGWGWYPWAKSFFDSTNKVNLLCAGNQVSKSSTQIRKCIDWATNRKKWPSLWRHRPTQFWYLYPDRGTVDREFNHKWVTEFMPREKMMNHPDYGWTIKTGDKRIVDRIIFNTGVTVYFRTYAQNVMNLQSGSVDAMFCDEELPVELYDELMARLFGTDGYYHMVFTATRNQDMWKRAIEGKRETELFPNAWKRQISMRDCFYYINGKKGAWNEERVLEKEAMCRSETERLRRVEGRFVTEVGRKYPQFDSTIHYIKEFEIPRTWSKYVGVDLGGGKDKAHGHPPAICFIAVREDNRYGVVYKGWRGDDGSAYTVSDVFLKYLEISDGERVLQKFFDHSSKDFGVIAQRAGEPFLPAVKDHEQGESVINSLFKHNMLHIFATRELEKLGDELSSLMRATPKRVAVDDFADAFRYGVVTIPWDWESIRGLPSEQELEAKQLERAYKVHTEDEKIAIRIKERRGLYEDEGAPRDKHQDFYDEIDEWNDLYG